MLDHVPILLGLAERALRRGVYTDLMGVGAVTLLPFFPQSLGGLSLLLAVSGKAFDGHQTYKIELEDLNQPGNIASVNLGQAIDSNPTQTPLVSRLLNEPPAMVSQTVLDEMALGFIGCAFASHVLLTIPCPPLAIIRPGQVKVTWTAGAASAHIGNLSLGFVASPPLAVEEVRAIRASPSSVRTFGFSLECPHCQAQVATYVTIDDDPDLLERIPEGSVDLSQMPAEWVCKCGKCKTPTEFMKKSVPWLFRNQPRLSPSESVLTFAPQYHHHRLDAIFENFRRVIQHAYKEEELQKFIEANPVLWAFLAPTRILHKPKILTHYVADFGILTSHRMLYFVEIEKPSTKLVTREGGRHHEVQAPFNQIRLWREVCLSHRRAVLDELGLSQRDVSGIRFIAVAGASTEQAACLRNDLKDDTTFLTFDEMASYLMILKSQIAGL